MMRRKPELLVPASSLEVVKVAVTFGADAVYIGGEAFGLRAKAKNFSMEDMAEGIRFAHEHGVKVYVTANILAKPLMSLAPYFATLLKPQGRIVLAGLIENQVMDVKTAYQPYFEMDGEFTFTAQEDKHWHRLSGFRRAP